MGKPDPVQAFGLSEGAVSIDGDIINITVSSCETLGMGILPYDVKGEKGPIRERIL